MSVLECGGKAAAFLPGGIASARRGSAAALESGSCATALQITVFAVIITLLPGHYFELQRNDPSLLGILTCHFTHWSYEQLAWDALAFTALGVACARRNARAAHATLLASVLVVPVAVLAFAPEVTAYRGLSGLASAMFALLLTLEWRRLTWPVIAFGIAFIAKLTYESLTGGAVFASDMGEDVVAVPVAHLAGALIGVIGGLRPRKLLLLLPLVLASCISVRPQIPLGMRANVAACRSADLTGEWSDRRATQLGPAWVKLVLRDDCSFTMRMQLLFARIVEDGVYAIEDDTLRFVRASSDTVWRFRRDKNQLLLEESPAEWHTYTSSSCGSSWPCSSR
jgi:hypothetical protein